MVILKTRSRGPLFYESATVQHPEQTLDNYVEYTINHPSFDEAPDEVIMYYDWNETGNFTKSADVRNAGTVTETWYYNWPNANTSGAASTKMRVYRIGNKTVPVKFRAFRF